MTDHPAPLTIPASQYARLARACSDSLTIEQEKDYACAEFRQAAEAMERLSTEARTAGLRLDERTNPAAVQLRAQIDTWMPVFMCFENRAQGRLEMINYLRQKVSRLLSRGETHAEITYPEMAVLVGAREGEKGSIPKAMIALIHAQHGWPSQSRKIVTDA